MSLTSVFFINSQFIYATPTINYKFTHLSKYKCVSVSLRQKYSSSIMEMLVVCATTVHRVGLQTAPNELCPHVPVMTWNTCAYTIQATGERLFLFTPSSSLSLKSSTLSFYVFPSL